MEWKYFDDYRVKVVDCVAIVEKFEENSWKLVECTSNGLNEIEEIDSPVTNKHVTYGISLFPEFKELIENEKRYVSQLSQFNLIFIKTLSSSIESSGISELEFKTMFSPVILILKINEKFLKKLEEANISKENLDYVEKVLNLFSQGEEFSFYLVFSQNYDESVDLIKKFYNENEHFKNFCLETNYLYPRIDSLLISPIQRFPRYKLILERIKKKIIKQKIKVPKSVSEKLENGIKALDETYQRMNDRRKEKKNSKIMFQICQDFTERFKFKLAEFHRKYLYHCEELDTINSCYKDYNIDNASIYLFNESIFFTVTTLVFSKLSYDAEAQKKQMLISFIPSEMNFNENKLMTYFYGNRIRFVLYQVKKKSEFNISNLVENFSIWDLKKTVTSSFEEKKYTNTILDLTIILSDAQKKRIFEIFKDYMQTELGDHLDFSFDSKEEQKLQCLLLGKNNISVKQ